MLREYSKPITAAHGVLAVHIFVYVEEHLMTIMELIHQQAGQQPFPGPSKALAKIGNKLRTIEMEFRPSLFPSALPTDNPDNVTVLDCEIVFALCGY